MINLILLILIYLLGCSLEIMNTYITWMNVAMGFKTSTLISHTDMVMNQSIY